MRLRRGALVDLYVEGGRSVAMVGENVLVLSEIATEIVQAVPDDGVVGLDEVTAAVVDVFGEPEPPASAAELTLQQVHELVAHGVLMVEEVGSRDGRQGALLDQRGIDQRHAAVEALRLALRHLRSEASYAWTPPAGVTGEALVAAAHQHHVVSYLAAHLDRLALPPRAAAELRVAAGHQRAGARLLAADLARALDVLDARGIRALAFKGVALATLAYGDFAGRGAGDLDLLVAPEDLESAHAALAEAGWRPDAGFPRPGPSWAWRHLVRTRNELSLIGSLSSVDLHWHLVPTRGTFPDFDALWDRYVVVDVDGHPVPTLAAYDALAHSAGHAAKDRWRWLRSLVDVHVLMSRPETWRDADRPLRHDQLLSVGVAARLFGLPGDAPEVAHAAAAEAASIWDAALADQVTTRAVHHQLPVPGLGFLLGLRATRRTGGSVRDVGRWLSVNALPPWITADEPSPHALVAVPKVLARRTREVGGRFRRR